MKKIRLDELDFDVLAGLEWTALPAELPEKKAMSDFMANNKGVRYGVTMRSHGITVIGHPEPKTPVPKGVPSAAALLALASQKMIEDSGGMSTEGTSEEQNWIVVEAIRDSDLYWLAAVRNGVPIPGMDIVATRDKVIEEVIEIVGSSNNFTVFTLDKEVRFNVIGQVNVVEKKFAEFIRGMPTTKAVPKLFSIGAYITVGIIVACLLLVGSWWAYSSWAAARKAEEHRRALQAQQQAKNQMAIADAKKYQETVAELIKQGLKDGMNDINTSLATPSPYENVVAWQNLIYKIDLYQSGWRLSGIDCSIDAEIPSCRVLLVRGETGVNRNLLNDHPDAVIDADAASYVLTGPALGKRPADLRDVASTDVFGRGLLSDLQELRAVDIGHDVTPSQEITKKVNIPAPPTLTGDLKAKVPGQVAAPAPGSSLVIQLGFGTGTVTIKGSALWQLSGISKYLDLPTVHAKGLQVTLDGTSFATTNWTLTLDYLVRTKPQPIIPPVSLGDKTVNIPVPPEYQAPATANGEVAGASLDGVALPTDISDPNPSAPQSPPSP